MIDARQHVVGKYVPYDFESISVTDTAVGFTADKLTTNPKPKKVFITVETATCRYRYDGSDPTASVGHLLQVGDILILEGFSQLNNFKAIRTGGTSAVLRCSYLR